MMQAGEQIDGEKTIAWYIASGDQQKCDRRRTVPTRDAWFVTQARLKMFENYINPGRRRAEPKL